MTSNKELLNDICFIIYDNDMINDENDLNIFLDKLKENILNYEYESIEIGSQDTETDESSSEEMDTEDEDFIDDEDYSSDDDKKIQFNLDDEVLIVKSNPDGFKELK